MLIWTDLHGCKKTFDKQRTELLGMFPDETIAVAGDLVDRGPYSKELIEWFIETKTPVCMGNHDWMMVNTNFRFSDGWMMNGGVKTLTAYEGKTYEHVSLNPTFIAHQQWIKNLPWFLEFPNLKTQDGRSLIISHAALKSLDFPEQIHSESIIWNREEPVDIGRFNVFGHTPHPEPILCANIDTGCVYWTKPEARSMGYGKMTCLRFPQMEIYQQECIDFLPEVQAA
jgi:serine/threonine protein phosphatase 1